MRLCTLSVRVEYPVVNKCGIRSYIHTSLKYEREYFKSNDSVGNTTNFSAKIASDSAGRGNSVKACLWRYDQLRIIYFVMQSHPGICPIRLHSVAERKNTRLRNGCVARL